jgi:hypothetical protein
MNRKVPLNYIIIRVRLPILLGDLTRRKAGNTSSSRNVLFLTLSGRPKISTSVEDVIVSRILPHVLQEPATPDSKILLVIALPSVTLNKAQVTKDYLSQHSIAGFLNTGLRH